MIVWKVKDPASIPGGGATFTDILVLVGFTDNIKKVVQRAVVKQPWQSEHPP